MIVFSRSKEKRVCSIVGLVSGLQTSMLLCRSLHSAHTCALIDLLLSYVKIPGQFTLQLFSCNSLNQSWKKRIFWPALSELRLLPKIVNYYNVDKREK